MSEIILHHYPISPFAEKVRVALGIKGLAWRSVIIPLIMPKPDLMPLTGGYRKTPVMQIGADIYCDTQCILRELERRFPEPSLYRGTDAGTANALAFWSDRSVFSPAVGIVFGARRRHVAARHSSRIAAKMSGRELRVERLKAATPLLVDQLRPQFGWFEAMLADGVRFSPASIPTLVDCSVYNPCWFIRTNVGVAPPLDELPRLLAWMDRVAAIGHGKPSESSSQDALAIAKARNSRRRRRAQRCERSLRSQAWHDACSDAGRHGQGSGRRRADRYLDRTRS